MITAFSFSEVGGHRVNEDAFAVFQHPEDSSCWICTLADGQGGQSGGGRAATLACQTIEDFVKKERVSRLVDVRVWESIFHTADDVVSADKEAGFTTLIGFCLINGRIFGGSNGDSAVAACGRGKCEELTSQQMKNPPIGSGAAAFVPFATKLDESWMILAMSDGVWKYVRWDRIQDAVRKYRGNELINEMQTCARLPRSGEFQDDFTVVVVQNDAGEP